MKIDFSSFLQAIAPSVPTGNGEGGATNDAFASLLSVVSGPTTVPVNEQAEQTIALDEALQSFLSQVKAPTTKAEFVATLKNVQQFISDRLDDQWNVEQTLNALAQQVAPLITKLEQPEQEQTISLLFQFNAKVVAQTRSDLATLIEAVEQLPVEQVEATLRERNNEEGEVSLYNMIQSLFIIQPLEQKSELKNAAFVVRTSEIVEPTTKQELKLPTFSPPVQVRWQAVTVHDAIEHSSGAVVQNVTDEAKFASLINELQTALKPIVHEMGQEEKQLANEPNVPLQQQATTPTIAQSPVVATGKIPHDVLSKVIEIVESVSPTPVATAQTVTEEQVVRAIQVTIHQVKQEAQLPVVELVNREDVFQTIVSKIVAQLTETKNVRPVVQTLSAVEHVADEATQQVDGAVKDIVRNVELPLKAEFQSSGTTAPVKLQPAQSAEEVTAIKGVESAPATPTTTVQYRPTLPVIHVTEKASFQAMREQFVQQFEQVVKTSKLTPFKNGQTLVIRLNPEHLGSMTIKLMEVNGEMSARILTTNATTKELVEQSAQQLKQTLSLQTLEVKQFGADMSAPQSSWQERQQQSEAGQQQRQQQQQRQKEQEEERSFQQWLDEER